MNDCNLVSETTSQDHNELVNQASKYLLVGGVCTLLDFILLFALTRFLGINYLQSSIFSFMSGTIFNYFLCTFFVFKIRTIKNFHFELFFYFIITGIGLAINTAAIWAFTSYLGLHFLSSKLIATLFTYWWNFGARRFFLHTVQ